MKSEQQKFNICNWVEIIRRRPQIYSLDDNLGDIIPMLSGAMMQKLQTGTADIYDKAYFFDFSQFVRRKFKITGDAHYLDSINSVVTENRVIIYLDLIQEFLKTIPSPGTET